MAMIQRVCNSYVLELHEAIHNWPVDSFKLALYQQAAVLSNLTTAYTSLNELAATGGYTIGGITLTVTPGYPQISATGKTLITFNNFIIDPANFTAYYGLIYNSSKANRAVAALDFGGPIIATNTFNWVWPPATDQTATIRMAAAA